MYRRNLLKSAGVGTAALFGDIPRLPDGKAAIESSDTEPVYVDSSHDLQTVYDSIDPPRPLWIMENIGITEPFEIHRPNVPIIYSGSIVPSGDFPAVKVTQSTVIINGYGGYRPIFVDMRHVDSTDENSHGVHAHHRIETMGKAFVYGCGGHGWYFESDEGADLNYMTGMYGAVSCGGDGICFDQTAGASNMNAMDLWLNGAACEGHGVNIRNANAARAVIIAESNRKCGLKIDGRAWSGIAYLEANGMASQLNGYQNHFQVVNHEHDLEADGAGSGWRKGVDFYSGTPYFASGQQMTGTVPDVSDRQAVYIDDGSNTDDGEPGWRATFDGGETWADI